MNCKHLFEPSLIITDDTFKVRLPYELESMCYEGMDDDETTSSEDSKSYDNQDGVSFICFYNFFSLKILLLFSLSYLSVVNKWFLLHSVSVNSL